MRGINAARKSFLEALRLAEQEGNEEIARLLQDGLSKLGHDKRR